MWTRRLLRRYFALEERSAHAVGDVDWDALPERCVLQLHVDRTPEVETLVARHGFRTLVLGRHPLDVLVSILHFARHEPETARWLEGRGGDESAIVEADPTSKAFVQYATGQRAAALLSVTPQWWQAADVRTRYEDLVASPQFLLPRIAAVLGATPAATVEETLAEESFHALQREATNVHFWRGRAHGWQELLTPRVALRIADTHRAVFERLGYVPPQPPVSRRAVRARWRRELVQPR
jgi:hypothetical protein